MSLSFSKYLFLYEVFRLGCGRVVSLNELDLNPIHGVDLSPTVEKDPKKAAQDRISAVKTNYQANPQSVDHIAAAVVGLKPCALVHYEHDPSSPAASIVSDKLKQNPTNAGAIQAELLRHGFKVRPDFAIIHINLPKYMTQWIAIGGKKECEELNKLYQCQYYLDFVTSKDHDGVTSDVMSKVNNMMHGRCDVFCNMGDGGINCKPIHRRIGKLLGYTDEQVEDWLQSIPGYDHVPDIKYPFELPPALASARKGHLVQS